MRRVALVTSAMVCVGVWMCYAHAQPSKSPRVDGVLTGEDAIRPKVRRVENDVLPKVPAQSAPALEATVEVAKHQMLASGGITFVLEVKNRSGIQQTALNPLHSSPFISLASDTGYPIQLGRWIPPGLDDRPLNMKHDFVTCLPYKLLAFSVGAPTFGTQRSDQADVAIPPGAKMRVRILIDSIIEPTQERPVTGPMPAGPVIPIPAGTYRLRIRMPLHGKSSVSHLRWLESEPITIDLIGKSAGGAPRLARCLQLHSASR
jgi:hypothetical protein